MIPGREKALLAVYKLYEKTGVPLLSKGIKGFCSFLGCDDPGYFLYVPWFSSTVGVSVLEGAQYFTYFLVFLLFSSLVFLSLIISFSWLSFFSVGLVALLSLKLSSVCDVYIASAAAFLMIPLVLVAYRMKSSKLLYLGFLIAGFLGKFCDLIRSYSSLAPFCIIVIMLIFNTFFSKQQKGIAMSLLLAGYCSVNLHYRTALNRRNTFLALHNVPPLKESYHVFWHNIYIGLGFTRNNYGIRWDDSCAQRAIKNINSSYVVGSKEGEEATRKLVYNIFKKDRHFFFQSLFARFGVVIMFFLLWFGWVGLIYSYFFPKPWYEELAFIFGFGISALPGILTIPCFQYLTGFITCTVLYVVYSFSYTIKKYRKNV